jgi:hypothetical protein
MISALLTLLNSLTLLVGFPSQRPVYIGKYLGANKKMQKSRRIVMIFAAILQVGNVLCMDGFEPSLSLMLSSSSGSLISDYKLVFPQKLESIIKATKKTSLKLVSKDNEKMSLMLVINNTASDYSLGFESERTKHSLVLDMESKVLAAHLKPAKYSAIVYFFKDTEVVAWNIGDFDLETVENVAKHSFGIKPEIFHQFRLVF